MSANATRAGLIFALLAGLWAYADTLNHRPHLDQPASGPVTYCSPFHCGALWI